METVDKIQIAEEMMTAAIVECREYCRYYAAINLAGVAEEVYGKLLWLAGKQTMRDEIIESAVELENAEGDPFLTRKDIKRAASYFKNAIKHMDSKNDRFMQINAKSEAEFAIAEAMENRDKLILPKNRFLDRFSEAARDFHAKNNPKL